MSEALDAGAVIETAADLDVGDEVRLARAGYEWASPMAVDDVDVVAWVDADGEAAFRAAEVELSKSRGQTAENPHVVEAVSGDIARHRQADHRNTVHRFDPVGSDSDDGDAGSDGQDIECPDCQKTFKNEHGLAIHRGHHHDGGDELSEDIDEELGLEDDEGEVDEADADPSPPVPDTGDIGTGELTAAVEPVDGEWRRSDVAGVETATNGHVEGGQDDGIETKGFADPDQADEDIESFPRPCDCGVVVNDTLEYQIHRTEAHGEPQYELDYIDPGEFQSHVEAAETVPELAEELEWGLERTLRALGIYGCEDAIGAGDIPDDPTATSDLLTAGSDADADQADRGADGAGRADP